MTFSEKLSYLLELSGASNAELARASDIDPSQVSRLRSGARNTPKRIRTVELMAEFFASRCTGDYQRASLAETLGDKKLLADRSVAYTADLLCSWLRARQSDSSTRLDSFMRSFQDYDRSAPHAGTLTSSGHPVTQMLSLCYLGNEGRRAAVTDVVDYLMTKGVPGEVYILSDENNHWMAQDKSFGDSLVSSMLRLSESGYSVRRIVSPLRDSVSAIESLDRWMPLYMTGALTTYHYPRLRDGLFRRFLIVSPGNFTLSSCSLGDQDECSATYICYDANTIEDDVRFFNNFLNKCVPLAEPYIYGANPVEFSKHLLDFHSIGADGMSKWLGMTCNVIPGSIIDNLEKTCTDPDNLNIIRLYRSVQTVFEDNLAKGHRFVEIVRPCSVDLVLQGKAMIAPSLLLGNASRCYTPDEYREHLLHLLHMMEKYSDYYVVVDEGDMPESELHLKENDTALLVRTSLPFTIFRTTEYSTLSAVHEYLMLQATRYSASLVIQRRHSIEKLNAMVAALG